MKLFTAGGCHLRRELFPEHEVYRQCDGMELNIQAVIIGWNALQQPLNVIQTYNEKDVM